MRFYLGTHLPNWLSQTTIPLFVSWKQLAPYKTLPRAQGEWCLDSAGFSILSRGGEHPPAKEYVRDVRRYRDEIGGLVWAACQDYMCEPMVLAQTGMSIPEHQVHTTTNYLDLLDLAPDLPWTPVLQGWTVDDYLRHIDLYARFGIDLMALPVVGVGSVCRRQRTTEIHDLLRRLSTVPLNLHGFGVKANGLRVAGEALVSADSMAWSWGARRLQRNTCGRAGHKNCANCLVYATRWYDDLCRTVGVH